MIEYANETVIKALKQYDMLLKSLKYTTDLKQKQEIGYQMTRIIQKVLDVTNGIYEKKFYKVLNKSTFLMDEERDRLLELINLVNERKTYVNNQISNNYEMTGVSFDPGVVLGEDKIDDYKEQVKVIEKYKNNIKLNGVLKDELTHLEISIRKANNKLSSNKILNRQLESKMIKLLDDAFERLSLFELKKQEKEIDLAYTELGYSLEKAKENAKIARNDCTSEIILECDNMLSTITLEYEKYKVKKLILRLIEMYKDPAPNYDELLIKREEINSIMSGIVGSELYSLVGDELNKQYATIKLEKQDIATLKSLMEEKEAKTLKLKEINEENDSAQFKEMLADLLENEKIHQEELLLEEKKKEEARRLVEMEKEKKRREEIIRRQKLMEEERNKEIEERTKRLLVEKQNPILFSSKDKEKVTESRSEKRTLRSDIKPSEDIFLRENNKRKVEEGIPVIKNNKSDNTVVTAKKVEKREEVFPKVKLEKKESIFPEFPELGDENSFFEQEEITDLNKDLYEDGNKKWF